MAFTCSRCDEPAAVFIPGSPRCRDCFKQYLRKTFKTSIGRLGAGGRRKIAVAVSGGESSTSAAILLQEYHSTLVSNPNVEAAHIMLIHVLRAVHSDSNWNGETPDENEDTFLERVPGPVRTLHESIPNSHISVATFDHGVAELYNKLVDVDDRADLMRYAIYSAVAKKATSVGYDTVILGTSASRAASDIIQAVVSGRGTQVHEDARGVTTVNDVRFVRPLNSIPVRLLVRFARMNFPEVDFIYKRIGLSLHSTVNRFVGAIGCDNPSSVHNVVRVAGRLEKTNGVSCLLCGYPITVNDTKQHCNITPENFCNNNDICECSESVGLCFGCTKCIERSGAKGTYDIIHKLANRESMRKEISEYLL